MMQADDPEYQKVFATLEELDLGSLKPVFKEKRVRDKTLSSITSEGELREILKEGLQLPFGQLFEISRLWFHGTKGQPTSAPQDLKHKSQKESTVSESKIGSAASKAQQQGKRNELSIQTAGEVKETGSCDTTDTETTFCRDLQLKKSASLTAEQEKIKQKLVNQTYEAGEQNAGGGGGQENDSRRIVTCNRRPFGVTGNEYVYEKGSVFGVEENRDIEFKSLVNAHTDSLPWKVMEKAKKFICACLNNDRKGIIYFGVGDSQEQESKYKHGEIIGLDVINIKDDINKAFQIVLDDHIKTDAGPLHKGGEQNCIALHFVPVNIQGNRSNLFVIEMEVARDWLFCEDKVYYSKTWTEKRGKVCAGKKALGDYFKVKGDVFDGVAIRTNGSSSTLNQLEVYRQVKKPLAVKYKEWKKKEKQAITKIKEMATPLFQERLNRRGLTFRCQFLGTEDVMKSDDDVMYAETLKKYTERSFRGGYYMTHCELHISSTQVWIEDEKSGVGRHFHPISRLLFITQDPDDKAVFGYVCIQPNHTEYIYKLYAFRSEETEVVIETLREDLGVVTKIMSEAGSSEEQPNKFSQETNDQLLMEKEEPEGSGQTLMREPKKRITHLQLRKKEKHEGKLQKHLSKMEHQVTNLRGKMQQRNEQLQDVTKQMTIFLGQIQEKDEETANLHNQTTALMQQLEEKDQQMKELEMFLSVAKDKMAELPSESSDWIISRDCIQLTGRRLGCGGWGNVLEGKFCSYPVAVKQIHERILSPFNYNLFKREMDIASRCRHPCLLQFIGATNDEGNPLFVTELMETSLRNLLEQRAPSESEISSISLDVAHALNYLHQKRPSPIVHRDISSANVLLWRKGKHWRGKVSDYGTAKFVQQFMTVCPGAMMYSAPETLTRVQTVKVDVYSFGVLLCEMCIREWPDPMRRDEQVARVNNRLNRAVIRKCLQLEPEARPSIQEIIDELEEPF